MNCPFCDSPDVKQVDGKTWCQSCQREIVEITPDAEPAPDNAASSLAPPPASLTKCPACARPISEAASCPGCGHPYREPVSPYAASATVVIYTLKVCVVAWIISMALLVFYAWAVASSLRS